MSAKPKYKYILKDVASGLYINSKGKTVSYYQLQRGNLTEEYLTTSVMDARLYNNLSALKNSAMWQYLSHMNGTHRVEIIPLTLVIVEND